MRDARRLLIGAGCVASGVAMCAWPTAMAELYALPSWRPLSVALGVRDTVIGAGLLVGAPPRRAVWWRARAMSDGLDGALIAWSAVRARAPALQTALRLGVAWALAAVARREARLGAASTPIDQPIPWSSSRPSTAGVDA